MAETASSGKGDFGKRLADKALMPVVATAASAAAGYVAKNGPSFFEETVLPKLRAATEAADAGDLTERLTARAKERGSLSRDELDRHVNERARARAARRKTNRKVG